MLPEFPDKGLKGYFNNGVITPKKWNYVFDSKMPSKRQYYINEYLSQYYAVAKEEVTFKIKEELKDAFIPGQFVNHANPKAHYLLFADVKIQILAKNNAPRFKLRSPAPGPTTCFRPPTGAACTGPSARSGRSQIGRAHV